MRLLVACLASASVALASESVFSIQDDLDAFPRYKIVTDSHPISPAAAEDLLSRPWNETSPAELSSPLHPPPTPSEYIRILADPKTNNIPPHTLQQEPQPYLCSIPRPLPPPHNATHEAEQRVQSKSEADRANRHGWALLEDMRGKCFFHIGGWWGYKFCYGGGEAADGTRSRGYVEQFHPLHNAAGHVIWPPVVDKREVWFVLGREIVEDEKGAKAIKKTDAAADDKEPENVDEPKEGDLEVHGDPQSRSKFQPRGTIQTKADVTFLSHKFTDGTLCDLTKRPREIEIQYHCSEVQGPGMVNPRIAHVKEITTCNYLMLVYTPRLCEDRAFRKVKASPSLEITCRRISDGDNDEESLYYFMSEEQQADYRSKKEKEGKQVVAPENEDPKPKIVGGTVVGAGKYFPLTPGEKPLLSPPKNWVSSTAAQKQAQGATEVEGGAAASIAYDVEPTVGGPNVGELAALSPLTQLARNPTDAPDAVYVVIASAKVGVNAWEILDDEGLKKLDLVPEQVISLVRDTKWKTLIADSDIGRRWFMIVVNEFTADGTAEGLRHEIRAIIGDDDSMSPRSGGDGGNGGVRDEKKEIDDMAEMLRKVQDALFGKGDEEGREKLREELMREVARLTKLEMEKKAAEEGDAAPAEEEETGAQPHSKQQGSPDEPGAGDQEGSKEEFFRDEL